MNVERAGLHQVRGKPSRMKPRWASAFGEALANHAEHGVVVDQVAGVHRGFRAQTERRAGLYSSAQQVSRRNLRMPCRSTSRWD